MKLKANLLSLALAICVSGLPGVYAQGGGVSGNTGSDGGDTPTSTVITDAPDATATNPPDQICSIPVVNGGTALLGCIGTVTTYYSIVEGETSVVDVVTAAPGSPQTGPADGVCSIPVVDGATAEIACFGPTVTTYYSRVGTGVSVVAVSTSEPTGTTPSPSETGETQNQGNGGGEEDGGQNGALGMSGSIQALVAFAVGALYLAASV